MHPSTSNTPQIDPTQKARILHHCEQTYYNVASCVEVHNWGIEAGLATTQTAPIDAIRRVKEYLNK